MPIVARAPGKLVVLGEYAVLDGAPALVLAVDRYAVATLAPSPDRRCHLETLMPAAEATDFATGERSGVPLVDIVSGAASGAAPWRARLDSRQFFEGPAKLGLGSSAAVLVAWAGAWRRHRDGAASGTPDLATLIDLHRAFQGGRGSGVDVAASLVGGAIEFRSTGSRVPQVSSVQLPNSVGFAGIFAGRSASTPQLVAHYRAWREAHPEQAASLQRRLEATAEAGSAAARGGDAAALIGAIAEYGRALQTLGETIGAEIVTAEHRQIGKYAERYGVAYKVSGAGGGDLGLACAIDRDALTAFQQSVSSQGFRAIDVAIAGRGLVVDDIVEEHAE